MRTTRLVLEMIMRVSAMVAVIGLIVWVGARWRSDEVSQSLAAADTRLLGAAAFLLACHIMLLTASWRFGFGRARSRLPYKRALRVFSAGWVTRYLPGKIWPYATRSWLNRREGLSVKEEARAYMVEYAAVIFGAVTLALVTGVARSTPTIEGTLWCALLMSVLVVPVGDFVLSIHHEQPVQLSSLVRGFPWKSFAFGASGMLVMCVSVWLVAASMVQPDAATVAAVIGAAALSWLAGAVFFFLPAGIGVRDIALVGALAGLVPDETVVAIVAAVRLLSIVVDVGFFLIVMAIHRWHREV